MNKVLFSSKTDQWATPQNFFDELNDEFNFNLDPCADESNHKCDTYFTKQDDGLTQDWGGIQYFVIRHMEEKLVNGLRNHITKVGNLTLWWLC